MAPDATPGVMTWDELLEHMDNLVEWGAGEIKGWKKNALVQVKSNEESCVADDAKHRVQVAQKLKGVCEEMCKEVGVSLSCALMLPWSPVRVCGGEASSFWWKIFA